MKMRVIAALAAALLLPLAAACGGDDGNASTADNANAESSSSDNESNSSGNRRDDIAKFLEDSGGMSAEQAGCVADAYIGVGISDDVIDAMLDGDFDVTDAGQAALDLGADDATKLAEANMNSFECFDMSIPGG